MRIINGWLEGALHIYSPNCNSRPENTTIDMIVIHNISLPPGQFGGPYIEQFFTNNLALHEHSYFQEITDMKVSAHVVIDRLGNLIQFVSFEHRAWHAGKSCYQGKENCNDFSIGIELEGTDEIPYTEEQYHQLSKLCQCLMCTYSNITLSRIVGHSDIAPGRKSDPGLVFDWVRLKKALF